MRNTNSIFNKRIPTLLGILLLLSGLAITTVLVRNGTLTISRASPSETPNNIQVSNITDTSFVVSYTTASKTLGAVTIRTSDGTKTFFDERTTQNTQTSLYNVHFIALTTLTPKTTYTFSIQSGGSIFLNNGVPFTVTTGATLPVPNQKQLLQGTIVTDSNAFPQEAIVYAKTSQSQIISTLLQTNGSYTLDLSSLRTANGNAYQSVQPFDLVQMQIDGGEGSSTIVLLAKQAASVPQIILSQDYDFTLATPLITRPPQTASFPVFANPQSLGKAISVQSLPTGIIDQRPVFKGIASPGASVTIEIHSTSPLDSSVQADQNGNWSYRPPMDLAPGQHTISITAPSANGISKTITQTFTVYAAGTQVNQPATPSATITPFVLSTPTTIPTIPPRLLTSVPSPTLTPIVITRLITPTPIPLGSSIVPTVGVAGLATVVSGILLFLLHF